MQSSSSSSSSSNRVIRHLLATVCHTSLVESSFQLLFVLGRFCLGKDSSVSNTRDVVSFSQHSDLILVLDHTRHLDGVLENVKVRAAETDEGYMVRDLLRDGKGGGLWVFGAEVGEGGVEFGGQLDLVDVVLCESFVDANGETGPDNVVGVDGRNEEDGFGGLDVVDEVAIGEVAACEVVKVSTTRLAWALPGYLPLRTAS
jgi:hypothetical protein